MKKKKSKYFKLQMSKTKSNFFFSWKISQKKNQNKYFNILNKQKKFRIESIPLRSLSLALSHSFIHCFMATIMIMIMAISYFFFLRKIVNKRSKIKHHHHYYTFMGLNLSFKRLLLYNRGDFFFIFIFIQNKQKTTE